MEEQIKEDIHYYTRVLDVQRQKLELNTNMINHLSKENQSLLEISKVLSDRLIKLSVKLKEMQLENELEEGF